MRKISPAGVRDDFLKRLTDLESFHKSGMGAFTSDADKSTLSEHSLLTAAVAWEGFVSDMFIACINREPAKFKEHLENAFIEQVKRAKTSKTVHEKFVKVVFPNHLDKKVVQELADSEGNNITFSSFQALESKAKKWLVTAYFDRFKNLHTQKKSSVDALIALRNHIAHRSERSHKAMNDALAKPALYSTGLRRGGHGIDNVGAWLKKKPAGHKESRLLIMVHTLADIARAF